MMLKFDNWMQIILGQEEQGHLEKRRESIKLIY